MQLWTSFVFFTRVMFRDTLDLEVPLATLEPKEAL